MSEPDFDILADLSAVPKRRPGVPCQIERMRAEGRDDLLAQWERMMHAHRTGTLGNPDRDVAAWFTAHGWAMRAGFVGRHRNALCTRCAS